MTDANQSSPDEDVMIDMNPQAEETIEISMEALKADGYEPPADSVPNEMA
jgi:hypothetical protein